MWWPVLPQIIWAAALLIAPGLVVASAVRFRGFDALALAPLLSVGVIVVTATLAPFLNVRFGPVPVAVVSLLVAAVGLLVVRFRAARQPSALPPGTTGGSVASVVVMPFAAFAGAAFLVAVNVVRAIGSPQAISQTYDAVFHLNSVKFALETGQASSLTIGGMTGGGFYPAGWNAVTTLVASATGADVPVAVNITSVVIAAVFWPLGCLLLTRWAVGQRASTQVVAGIACASLGAFPLLMMDFGVLYPNLLAISLLPAAIALAASLAGLAPGSDRRDLPMALLLLLGLAGLVIAHPTTFTAWLTWTLPMAASLAWRRFGTAWRNRRTERARATAYALSLCGYGAIFVILWVVLRPPADASFWKPRGTVPQALGEALMTSPVDLPPAWLVAPLTLLGLWACFREPKRFAWLGLAFILFAGLYIVVAGFPVSPTRDFLTGGWYNDSPRVAALLPVAAVVLVAVGTDWAAGALSTSRNKYPHINRFLKGSARWSPAGRLSYRAVGGAVLILAAAAVGQQGGLREQVRLASSHYRLEATSLLVSPDELALLKRLPHSVPEDAVLIDNPYTGAALSYAIGGRKSAQLHMLSYVSPEIQRIYDGLGRVTTDPSICQAVREKNSFYVLDFGTREVHRGYHTPPGLTRLDQNPGLQLIDSQGRTNLYKITACGS